MSARKMDVIQLLQEETSPTWYCCHDLVIGAHVSSLPPTKKDRSERRWAGNKSHVTNDFTSVNNPIERCLHLRYTFQAAHVAVTFTVCCFNSSGQYKLLRRLLCCSHYGDPASFPEIIWINPLKLTSFPIWDFQLARMNDFSPQKLA